MAAGGSVFGRRQQVQVIRRAVARTAALGMNADSGNALLELVVDGLTIIRQHRRLILSALAAIDQQGMAQAHVQLGSSRPMCGIAQNAKAGEPYPSAPAVIDCGSVVALRIVGDATRAP